MTDMLYTPKSEVDTRIQAFQNTLEQLGIDGALIIHHTNLFYLSGTSQSSHLFIPRSGKPILMVRKSFERACKESPIEEIMDVKSLKMIPDILKIVEQVGKQGKYDAILDLNNPVVVYHDKEDNLTKKIIDEYNKGAGKSAPAPAKGKK